MTKNPITAFIVEDEIHTCNMLINMLGNIPDIRVMGFATDSETALDSLLKNTYDLVFMDINIPGISGLEVIEKCAKNGVNPHIIITTAYQEHAIQAFELGAIDYLLKPYSIDRLKTSIERAIAKDSRVTKTNRTLQNETLGFREGENYYLLPFNEIVYLTSQGKHTIIATKDQEFETPLLLKDLLIKLPSEKFIRIHKQHVVQISAVSHLQYNMGGRYLAFLKHDNDLTLPVGATFANELRKGLGIK